MYFHPGGNQVIRKTDLVGIFDLDKCTVSKKTRSFLNEKEKQNKVILLDDDLPQSFIIATKGNEEKVYLSQISSKTLYMRLSEE